MLNTYQANLSTVEARLAHRTPLYVCDMCGERAQFHVHRIEGATVATAVVCRACKQEWEAKR